MTIRRRLPVGAEVIASNGTSFRVWAPKAKNLSIILNSQVSNPVKMEAEQEGYWSAFISFAKPGDQYQFQFEDSQQLFPDPASRYQSHGPHQASTIVDPFSFEWTDGEWNGINPETQVLYEMHVGTLTPEGTYLAAARELKELAEMGITTIELMPIAEFDGKFGWGYDGVSLFAPYHYYGSPDDLRTFINEAHTLGLGVILDVVYNHFGPSGAYHNKFSDDYFSKTVSLDWGDAINFDGAHSQPVREFFLANARYWIEEFHFDGLRLDATHFMYDDSEIHIISEIVQEARKAAGTRHVYLIGENEPQLSAATIPVEEGGYGLNAVWNDDFHHSSNVALRGKREAYFSDYRGNAQEILSAIKWGYLYQGQYFAWQKHSRGTPALNKPFHCYIHFLQNHDQIANSGFGKRLHKSAHPGNFRALTALLLLAPQTPLLFQGQEFGASAPFNFFADHAPEMAVNVEMGRFEFLSQFPSLNTGLSHQFIKRPHSSSTFEECKLDLSERASHTEAYSLHKDLLALRHRLSVFTQPARMDGAVLSETAICVRFISTAQDKDQLLIINLGPDLLVESVAEPLLASPSNHQWQLTWSSEHPKYGGDGIRSVDLEKSFVLTSGSALLFSATLITTEK